MSSANPNNGGRARNRCPSNWVLPAPPWELFASLAIVAGLCGCAVTPVPASAVAAKAAPEAAPGAASRASINGYRRQVKAGEELYCREDALLGSRVKGREICYTAHELEQQQKAADELLRNARGAVGETAAPRMDRP
jgi:hypothetical protein